MSDSLEFGNTVRSAIIPSTTSNRLIGGSRSVASSTGLNSYVNATTSTSSGTSLNVVTNSEYAFSVGGCPGYSSS